MIVGAGSIASRTFLETLSGELVQLFARKQIPCAFTYVGKIPRGTNLDLNPIVTSEYESYLVLCPVDTAYTDLNKDVATYASPVAPGYLAYGTIRGTQYVEDFSVALYTKNKEGVEKIWQGELKLDFDFSQPRIYRKVAQSLFYKIINTDH